MTTQAAPTTVTASDGVPLAVHAYTEIDKRRPDHPGHPRLPG